MTETRYDVIAIGNAIVDVMAPCDEALVERLGLNRGGMTLVDAQQAQVLYDAMGPAKEISGGSAANTLAGMAALGARCAFIGQVASDQLGEVFSHDIRAGGIDFATPAREGEPPTARCLIFVTPDGERTMNTFLGASQFLPPAALDDATIAAAGILYLEGYLWDPEHPRAAMKKAIKIARDAGRKVAFTLSDVFCVEGHREDFIELLAGHVDVMFGNENEVCALYQTTNLDAAMSELGKHAKIAVVTRSESGAVVLVDGERHVVPCHPATQVLDTTGAGDCFVGYLATRLSAGDALDDAIVLANAAAALSVTREGAGPSMPTLDEVRRFLS